MALILLPQRHLSQPQYAAPIDYQGLGRGVQLLLNPAIGPVDQVTGRAWTPGGNVSVVTSTKGKAYQFDGVDDHYSYTGYPEISGASGTFAMWCPVVGPADNFGSVLFGDAGTYFWIDNSDRVYAWATIADGKYPGWFNTVNRSIIFSSNGTPSGTKLYIDGSELTTVTWSGALTGFAAGNKALRFGAYANGNAYDFNGQASIGLYSSRVWNDAEARLFHDTQGLALFAPIQRRIWLAGAPATDATGTATGTSTASGVGASTFESTGASAGTSTVSGVGSSGSEASATGAASGLATVAGTGAALSESSGNAQGASTASGQGVGEISSTGAAAGTSTVTGVGTSSTGSSGTASGTSAVSASGASLAASSGSGNGVATVTGIGAAVTAAIGSASGTSTVSGVGDSVVPGSATGAASGSSTVSGVGASVAASTGTASGESVVTGKSVPVVVDSDSFGGGYLYISREEHEERRKRQRIALGIIEPEKLEQFEISNLTEKRQAVKKKIIPARQQKKIDQEALNLELKALLQKEAEREEEIILRMLMEL